MSRTPDSLQAFLAEAEPALRGTALLLTGDRQHAAAAVTGALAATSRRWRRLDPGAALPVARAALVRTVLAGFVPDTARRLGNDLADDDLAWSALQLPDADPDPSDSDRTWLAELAGLPVRARIALVLRLHDGLADDETARLLDTDPATVAGLVDAALRHIGPLLDEPGPDVPEPSTPEAPVPEAAGQQGPPPDDDPDDEPDDDPYAIYRRPR